MPYKHSAKAGNSPQSEDFLVTKVMCSINCVLYLPLSFLKGMKILLSDFCHYFCVCSSCFASVVIESERCCCRGPWVSSLPGATARCRLPVLGFVCLCRRRRRGATACATPHACLYSCCLYPAPSKLSQVTCKCNATTHY